MLISPVDARWSKEYSGLVLHGEDQYPDYAATVEMEWLRVICKARHLGSPGDISMDGFSEAVRARERTCHHQTSAVVEEVRARVHPDLAPLIHLGLTSSDVDSIVRATWLRGDLAQLSVLLETLRGELERVAGANQPCLAALARTHGQPAAPVAWSHYWMAMRERLCRPVDVFANATVAAKCSGVVGTCALGLLHGLRREHYEELLRRFALVPAVGQLQTDGHGDTMRWLADAVVGAGTVAAIAETARQMCRPELGELVIHQKIGEHGSSTVGQKVNPIDFERSIGCYRTACGILSAILPAMVTDHYRDLTDSVPMRFQSELLFMAKLCVQSCSGGLFRCEVHASRISQNLTKHYDEALSEAARADRVADGCDPEVARRLPTETVRNSQWADGVVETYVRASAAESEVFRA